MFRLKCITMQKTFLRIKSLLMNIGGSWSNLMSIVIVSLIFNKPLKKPKNERK